MADRCWVRWGGHCNGFEPGWLRYLRHDSDGHKCGRPLCEIVDADAHVPSCMRNVIHCKGFGAVHPPTSHPRTTHVPPTHPPATHSNPPATHQPAHIHSLGTWRALASSRRASRGRTDGVSLTTFPSRVLLAMPSAKCTGIRGVVGRLRAKRLRAKGSIGGTDSGGRSLRTSGGVDAGGSRPMPSGSPESRAFLAPAAR